MGPTSPEVSNLSWSSRLLQDVVLKNLIWIWYYAGQSTALALVIWKRWTQPQKLLEPTYVIWIWKSGATAALFAIFLCWDLRPCFFKMPKDLVQCHPQSDYTKDYGGRMDGPPLNPASRTSPFWEFVSQGLGRIASEFIMAACNCDRKPKTFAGAMMPTVCQLPGFKSEPQTWCFLRQRYLQAAQETCSPASRQVPQRSAAPFFAVEAWLICRRTDLSLWQNHPQVWQNLIIILYSNFKGFLRRRHIPWIFWYRQEELILGVRLPNGHAISLQFDQDQTPLFHLRPSIASWTISAKKARAGPRIASSTAFCMQFYNNGNYPHHMVSSFFTFITSSLGARSLVWYVWPFVGFLDSSKSLRRSWWFQRHSETLVQIQPGSVTHLQPKF